MGGDGRGRLSALDLMPPEAEGIVAWAAAELAGRDRTQTDIYAEFVAKCEALMAEHRGELEFQVPAFASFNRYSVRLARMTRRLDQTNRIVAALASTFDAKKSDDLTIMAAESVKALVLHLLGDGEGLVSKDVLHLASALKAASQAQGQSADARRKADAEFGARVDQAVEAVARVKGMTADTVEAIKARILGVKG